MAEAVAGRKATPTVPLSHLRRNRSRQQCGHATRIEGDLVRDVTDQLRDYGIDGVVVNTDGTYPETEIVVTLSGSDERSDLWSYDDENPLSLDYEFTTRRVRNLAESMVTRSKDP